MPRAVKPKHQTPKFVKPRGTGSTENADDHATVADLADSQTELVELLEYEGVALEFAPGNQPTAKKRSDGKFHCSSCEDSVGKSHDFARHAVQHASNKLNW